MRASHVQTLPTVSICLQTFYLFSSDLIQFHISMIFASGTNTHFDLMTTDIFGHYQLAFVGSHGFSCRIPPECVYHGRLHVRNLTDRSRFTTSFSMLLWMRSHAHGWSLPPHYICMVSRNVTPITLPILNLSCSKRTPRRVTLMAADIPRFFVLIP